MSDFLLYFNLGLHHVLDWQAYDHVLFIVALCASYSLQSWKRLLGLVSMFTLGHTLSLFMAHFMNVSVSETWIEFLIPVTIISAAVYNLTKAGKKLENEKVWALLITALFFGLIHGFGFGRYYNQINDDREVLPILEFALGIELSQVIIVAGVVVLGYFVKTFFNIQQRDWVLVISSVVIGMTLPMLIENWP
jgi:hydrogenase/urease accessory protein HupE